MKTKILFLLLILSFGTVTFAQKEHVDREQIEKEKIGDSKRRAWALAPAPVFCVKSDSKASQIGPKMNPKREKNCTQLCIVWKRLHVRKPTKTTGFWMILKVGVLDC